MIRLHIAWANALYSIRRAGHWLYEFTHEKADDGDTFQPMLDELRAEKEAGVEWIHAHAYVMHGPNRLHWDRCPCQTSTNAKEVAA